VVAGGVILHLGDEIVLVLGGDHSVAAGARHGEGHEVSFWIGEASAAAA
jgi:arginase family enzyme